MENKTNFQRLQEKAAIRLSGEAYEREDYRIKHTKNRTPRGSRYGIIQNIYDESYTCVVGTKTLGVLHRD